MSAAVLILACGNVRRMSRYSWFMSHKASYTLEGDHDKIVEEVAHMEQEEQLWAHWMEELSTTDSEYWLSSCHKKNMYLTAEECLQHGVIDEII
jgi:ATP-dependent protease ClpP protease subunit